MPEQLMASFPFSEAVQLEPFEHQVGGHTVVLHYDETTLCKPLNKREQRFYITLPEDLREFTAEYRGVIDVQFQEDDDGFISIFGYHNNTKESSYKTCSGSTSPSSSGSDGETSSDPHPSQSTSDKPGNSIRFLQSGSIENRCHTEEVFKSLESSKDSSHSPWGLRCHKMLLSKWKKQGQSSDTSKFILLENVAANFKRPCVLDLKMGTRQYGDDAPELKKIQHMNKCLKSTSGTLGVRFCGMQVYQVNTETYIFQDKYYGRDLSTEGFKNTICQFLQNDCTVRLDVIQNIIQKLTKLYKLVEKQDSFRFYSSSLLIIYDGMSDTQNLSQENMNSSSETVSYSNNNRKVVIRMIDFAHTTHHGFIGDKTIHEGPDKGYLLGLESLIKMFQDVQNEFTT